MIPPEPGKPLLLYISVTDKSLGALIAQEKGGVERPVYYLSRMVRGAECNYTPIERQCLALVYVAQRLRHYMLAHKIHLISKSNPLRYLMKNPVPTSRMTRWILALSEFDIQVVSPTAKKSQALAELLAAFPTTGMDVDHPDLPGELQEIALIEEPEWQLMFDGAASAGGGGIGIVLVGPESQVITKTCKLLYSCSNNEAEYEALITGLELAESKNIKRLLIKGDSRLAIQQLKGEFAVKEPALAKYRTKAQQILQNFQGYRLEHVVRSQNRYADALATLASKMDVQKDQHAVITVEAKGIMEAGPSNEAIMIIELSDWRKVYLDYLVRKISPDDPKEERKLQKHITKYLVKEGHLYRRAYNGEILKCISDQEADEVLREIHEGDCGEHQGGRRLYEEALRLGYFWPTMEKDAMGYAQKCQNCQLFGNKIHAPSVNLHPVNTPWPFHTWALDLIGPISPPSRGRIWILTATENFTKWAEAVPLKKATSEAIAMFILEHIICRFGVPRRILTDNGRLQNPPWNIHTLLPSRKWQS
ncbi:hypothetical protein UlMin_009663 [Ulmus minor]